MLLTIAKAFSHTPMFAHPQAKFARYGPVNNLSLTAEGPSLASLRLIKWKDEKGETQRYSLLEAVSSEWQSLETSCCLTQTN